MLFELSRLVVGSVLASLFKGGSANTVREELAPGLRGKRSLVERDGGKRTIFQHEATGASLDFVTNSGICETTPGVNQYSGYLNVGSKYKYIPIMLDLGSRASGLCSCETPWAKEELCSFLFCLTPPPSHLLKSNPECSADLAILSTLTLSLDLPVSDIRQRMKVCGFGSLNLDIMPSTRL